MTGGAMAAPKYFPNLPLSLEEKVNLAISFAANGEECLTRRPGSGHGLFMTCSTGFCPSIEIIIS
jgi:hypothetical protein